VFGRRCCGGGRHRFDGLGVEWRGRREGMLANSATSMPLIRQPGLLQPQNGTNHQLIKQFNDSYRFEVNLETDNEVRAARVDC
jgi:lipid II:glycine glycyltransferase (peptidoglycan interpeptide bridge formation enzyme)